MKKLRIKKGDTVQVTAGADKGKKGAVLVLDKDKLKMKVQGVRIQTHFSREDGLQQKEGFIDYSNVKLVETGKVAASGKAKTTQTSKKKKSSSKTQ